MELAVISSGNEELLETRFFLEQRCAKEGYGAAKRGTEQAVGKCTITKQVAVKYQRKREKAGEKEKKKCQARE